MRSMVITVVSVLLCLNVMAQPKQIFIYRNPTDFKQRANPLIVQHKDKANAIKVSNMFFSRYMYIKNDSCKVKIPLDSIFAYTDNVGNTYRIWNKATMMLCESDMVHIYSQPYWNNIKIRSAHGFRYDRKKTTNYFFSISDTSDIIPLTRDNVIKELWRNKNLDKEFASHFPDDKSLIKTVENKFILNQFIKEHK